MKVYVVVIVVPYEGMTIEEVYTNKIEAINHIESFNNIEGHNDNRHAEYADIYIRDLKHKYEGA